jgi:hypothetical protein
MLTIRGDAPDFTQQIPDPMAVIMSTIGDEVEAAIMKMIEDRAASFAVPMIAAKDKAERLAENDRRVTDRAYDEELAYRAAVAAGHAVQRRPKFPLMAALQIAFGNRPRKHKADPDDFMSDDSGDDARGDQWAAKRRAELDARTKKLRKHKRDWLG